MILTKFTLVKDKNKDGIEYSRVLPFMVREMDSEELQKTAMIKKTFAAAMRQRPLSPETEYNAGGEARGAVVRARCLRATLHHRPRGSYSESRLLSLSLG